MTETKDLNVIPELTPSEVVLLNAELFAGKAKRKRPIGVLLLLVLFQAVSVYLMVIGFKQAKTAFDSYGWTRTGGKIISSQLVTTSNNDGDPLYQEKIIYEYSALGRTFQSDQIYSGATTATSKEESKQKIVDKYPAGKDVDVYYDADDPKTAVLERGVHFNSVIVFLMGLLFFVTLIFLVRIKFKEVF